MATLRKAISKRIRFEIFKRDSFECQYCGAHPPGVLLHVDHITPIAVGGANDIDNLVTACQPCNAGKGAQTLSSAPQSLSERAAIVAEREAQLAGYQAVMEARRGRIEDEVWRVAAVLDERATSDGMRRDWLRSVKGFVERIGVFEVLDAADAARAKCGIPGDRMFRYFCGVCWGKIEGGRGVRKNLRIDV